LAYGLITDIAICLIAAWVLAVGFNAFKQPVLLAYLVAGFALGPHGFGWVTDEPSIATVADMGLILLLFMIGLEIDLRKMLVILALGRTAGEVSDHAVAAVAFTFSLLAAGSTYAILGSDALTRRLSPWLTRLGLPDLDATPAAVTSTRPPGVFLLGFSWTASSLLEEIRRERPDLLADLRVVDFNPVVHEQLQRRGVSVVYGDITQRDVLLHAGLSGARIIICSLPNTVLRGATNLRLLQQVRQLNPEAQILVHAERLVDVPALYAAGANWVILPRLLEAGEIFAAIAAAEKKLLHEKRQADEAQLRQRDEVIP
jgi:voltage-gated potassium channel Kch